MKRKALGSKEVLKASYVDQKWAYSRDFRDLRIFVEGHRIIDVKRIKNKRVRKAMFTIYLPALILSLWDLCLSICTVLVLLQLEIEFLMGVVIHF